MEAEQAVIGGLMLRPDALADVGDLLSASDFYRREHAAIFEAILDQKARGKPFDAVTLGDWFETAGKAEMVDNGAYLGELVSTTASAANVRAYAEIVADKATLRQVIEVGSEIVGIGFDPEGRQAAEIVSTGAAKFAALTLRGAREGSGLRMIGAAMKEAWDEINGRFEGSIEIGLTPPWENVRAKLPGLEDTDLMVIAARPGMGKTVAGLEFADHAARQGRNVAFFSLEMSQKQLAVRLVARRARVDQSLMRQKGALSNEDWAEINGAYKDLRGLPLAIDDTAELTIEGIKARASRMHAKVPGGLGLIVVDYMQLISGDGRHDDKRHDEVTKISRGLKLLAKELRSPVIALSQLNRGVEARTDKRPQLSDLRESGAIEQDADIIAFLYRDDYYTKEACGAPGIAEFIIAKQRQGALGKAYLEHHLECSRFDDYHGPTPSYSRSRAGSASNDGFDDDLPLSGRDRAAGGRR